MNTPTVMPLTDFFAGIDLGLDIDKPVKPSLKQRLLHRFGLCNKARKGYTCHGGNNLKECGRYE